MTDLAKQLKEGTKESHSAAENTKFVASFLRGVLDPEEYRKLITDFYYVYSTMEKLIQETRDPLAVVLKQWQVDLIRTTGLEQDLRYYYGPMWRSEIKPSEPCNTYVDRLKEVAKDNPYLLIAHHYTRYIGDLSGGQILKNIAQNALQPREGEGLKFYDFPRIDNAKEWKVKYRSTLDTLELDQSQVDALIAEANNAFRLNMLLFDELKGNASKSLFKVIVGFVKSKLSGGNK